MDVSHEDVRSILEAIATSSVDEFRLEADGLTIYVRKKGAPRGADEASDDGGHALSSLPSKPEHTASKAGPAARGALAVPKPPGTKRPWAGAIRPRDGVPKSDDLQARDGLEIRAPMLGVFYRAPSPGARPFVEIGSLVAEQDVVCIIEVMKLMNSITAGCKGRVAAILAEDGAMVEYDQPLVAIEPAP